MPKTKANGLTLNYEQEGNGPPLILIPYLAADHACYAFQVPEYAKHFTCISLDLRGTGESDKPDGVYSTETLADDVAAFMQAMGIERAHIWGLSLGAATGMWLAAKHPGKVKSLSLHSAWAKTDAYQKAIVEGWQATARALNSVPEMVILSMFPWCFTAELYESRPEYVESLKAFVRSRPAQPVAAFLQQSNAVIAHDAETQLGKITAPVQITFGRQDMVTPIRLADRLTSAISGSELTIFEACSHAGIYENVADFNQKSLTFLQRHSIQSSASSAAL